MGVAVVEEVQLAHVDAYCHILLTRGFYVWHICMGRMGKIMHVDDDASANSSSVRAGSSRAVRWPLYTCQRRSN
eukprot:6205757-Pleurochrysis_carterae.AAC.1